MNTADVLLVKTTGFTHREWHIVPDAANPDRFNLKTATGNVICTLAFPKNCNASILKLIASGPGLQDIAGIYRDAMTTGSHAKKTMIFTTVNEILNRINSQQ